MKCICSLENKQQDGVISSGSSCPSPLTSFHLLTYCFPVRQTRLKPPVPHPRTTAPPPFHHHSIPPPHPPRPAVNIHYMCKTSSSALPPPRCTDRGRRRGPAPRSSLAGSPPRTRTSRRPPAGSWESQGRRWNSSFSPCWQRERRSFSSSLFLAPGCGKVEDLSF